MTTTVTLFAFSVTISECFFFQKLVQRRQCVRVVFLFASRTVATQPTSETFFSSVPSDTCVAGYQLEKPVQRTTTDKVQQQLFCGTKNSGRVFGCNQ